VLEELRGVQDQLGLLIKAVEAAPATSDLRVVLERGVAGTRKIGGKHGAAPVSYSEVVVAIPDSPGALARLFADVSAAGVNVEDISIEHDPILQIGYLALSVAPEYADGLMETMLSHGWAVS
jgi:prephenate dehydrogenase